MYRFSRALVIAAVVALPLAGCDESPKVAAPAPREPTASSVAMFCNMAVLEHPGPKGQVFLKEKPEPLWFASVRDTIAFTLLPEEPKEVAAIYVNDMGKAKDWQHPEAGSWVEARAAWYVLGSDYEADMGGHEAVPFGAIESARRFAAEHGGTIARLADVPQDYVLGGDAEPPDHAREAEAHNHAHAH